MVLDVRAAQALATRVPVELPGGPEDLRWDGTPRGIQNAGKTDEEGEVDTMRKKEGHRTRASTN